MRTFSSLHAVVLSLLVGAALATWLLRHPRANAVPPLPEAATGVLDAGVGVEASTQDPDTATIVFVTTPNVAASVFWGRKLLGKILPGKPLVVVRPRDSGPLDVMVRSANYMPVQTRAHTFSDSRVLVKLTPPDRKNELLGYRIPLEAGVDGGEASMGAPGDADAGVAWPSAASPGTFWDGGAPVAPAQ